jgi:glutamine amidotransferase
VIAVVDYGRGNLFSIGQALDHLEAPYEITGDPEKILNAERIILPGVGAFADAMDAINSRGLGEAIIAAVADERPLLGICLGMQLLASTSKEFGEWPGLNLIPGIVKRLPEGEGPAPSTRIPNVGWRRLTSTSGSILDDISDRDMVYFQHSYAFETTNPKHTIGKIEINGCSVAAAVQSKNTLGFQFHPEKSGECGLSILKRFLDFPS